MSGFFEYWGKAGKVGTEGVHLLPYHSLDASAVALALLQRERSLLPRIASLSGFTVEELLRVLPFVVGLHDLGKFAESFQDLRRDLATKYQGDRAPVSFAMRHDSLGWLLWRSWSSKHASVDERALHAELHPIALASGPACGRDVSDLMEPWMAAILGHHGKPPEEGALPGSVFQSYPQPARSRCDAAAFARALKALLQPEPLALASDVESVIPRMKRSSWWVAGFVILCDWIASNASFFEPLGTEMALESYWERSREAAERAVAKTGLGRSFPRAYGGMEQLFPDIADRPSPLQRAAASIDIAGSPQLFVLEDLTGSGKTEAALILAHRLLDAGRGDGIFFALPTMATANAMHGRVRPLLSKLLDGEPSYLLTHSGPRLGEDDRLAIAGRPRAGKTDGDESASTAAGWLSDSRKKALLAELGVGTIDQALLAALQSKHAALRLFGLHRHVLIVDEVHACDEYMLEVLCALLRLHAGLGGSAILLSATLTLEQRRRLTRAFTDGLGRRGAAQPESEKYPLLTATGGGAVVERPVESRAGSPRTLPVVLHTTVAEVASRIARAAEAGLCACWIRNSVADALEAHAMLAEVLGADRVTLFHARFALGDRLRIETEVADRFGKGGSPESRCGRVVVATQVVEQSLDVDFDVLVTDLCPIDRLIQRAGRLHRHIRPELQRGAPVLDVLAPAWAEDPPPGWLAPPFRRTATVYQNPGVLWRTLRELVRRECLELPGSARPLIEAVFAGEDVPESLQARSNQALGQDLAHGGAAWNAVVSLDHGYRRQGADWSGEAHTPTRLGEPTVTLRLARGDAPEPWFREATPSLRWPLSQLSVARRLVARPWPGDEAERKVIEADQPFLADDVVTVVLRPEGEERWSGRALAERGVSGHTVEVPVRLSYTAERGLTITEGA